MASFKYSNYRSEAASGTMLWPSLTVKLALVSASYVPSEDHIFLSEVNGVLATSGAFTGLSFNDGYALGACPEFLLLRLDPPIAGAVLFDDTGDPATSRLIAFSNDGPAFPFNAVGFNYSVVFNAAFGGWFRI